MVNSFIGNLTGDIGGQRIPLSLLQADIHQEGDGQLDWRISFGNASQAAIYLPLLPSLSLPYGWLTASENPPQLLDGLELTGNGSFTAMVVLTFQTGEELTLQHSSQGLSTQQPGRVVFTSQVSGSHPQDFNASSLFPLALILSEQTAGSVQGTATQASVTLNLNINYQPADAAAPRPALGLTLEQQDLSSDSREITFSVISTLQQPSVAGTLQGSIDNETLPASLIRATVDPEVDGQLRWNLSIPEESEAPTYLPFLPALVLPAGWLTADERPEELRDGLESSGDGKLNATVLLSFPSGEQLRVEVSSAGGITATQPPVLEYNSRISGSHPPSFDASQLLPLALLLQEDPVGILLGEQVLAGNVTISVSINYSPVDPEPPTPALVLTLERTDTQVSEDGRSITFMTRSTLTAVPGVEELEGSLDGTLNGQPVPQTQITATVSASRDGQVDWKITFSDGAQANTYLPLLPSLSLPYGWLTASENPPQLLDGLELTGNGSFTAMVVLTFQTGEELTLQHSSQGLSTQQPGRVVFTSQVSGSHPQDFNASSLFPLALILSEQTAGSVQGTATQASVILNLNINYQPADAATPRPALVLTLEHHDFGRENSFITFTSSSLLERFIPIDPNVTSPPTAMVTPSVILLPSPVVTPTIALPSEGRYCSRSCYDCDKSTLPSNFWLSLKLETALLEETLM